MIINTARFVISSPSVDKAPATDRHEYAFIGRSNVGKSSLINMLTGRKGLAMTSATPGKTMLINHFLINDSWYIVDLPGYGYAQRSKKELAKIDNMIRDYILNREQMTNLFLLIDSRLEPQKIDLKFMEWLGENGVPFSIVFTKLDKMSKTKGEKMVAEYCAKLLEEWEELPPIFVTSSEDKRGREQLLDYIEQLNRLPVGGFQDDRDEDAPHSQSTPAGPHTEPNEPSEFSVVNNENNQNSETMDQKKTPEEIKAEEIYPGAAIDAADNDHTTEEAIKQRTDVLDDNPNS